MKMTTSQGARTPFIDPIQDGYTRIDSAVEQRLQTSLAEVERSGGPFGWLAARLMSTGDWLEREVEERKQMIGGIDNMWLLVSEVTDFNPVCACTYILRGQLTLEVLEAAIHRVEKKFPKYCQRLTSLGRKFHGPRFEDYPDYNVRNHIRSIRLPEPAGKAELDALMGEFIAQDWDLTKPLWEMVLVENYRDENGGECALVSRGHHTLADGQGFVISQLYMTSFHDELIETMNGVGANLDAAKRGRLLPSKVHHLLRPLDKFATSPHAFTAFFIQIFLASLFWATYFASVGLSLFLSMYQAYVQATMFLLTFWRVEMLSAPQHGPRVREREYSSSKPVKMEDIRLCQRAFSGMWPGSVVKSPGGRTAVGHVTLNDVMCSVMVDVLGEEIESKSRDTAVWGRIKRLVARILPSPIGFFIPISIRKPGDWSMRNLSTGSMVYLNPSSEEPSPTNLYKHIHRCRAALSVLKHSLLPRLLFYLTQWSGQAPALWPVPFALVNFTGNIIREWVFLPLIKLTLRSFPVILTNVPGPAKKPIKLEGIEVISWTALPPQGGKGTLGMGIISYAGGLCISIAADKVPGSEGVAKRICDRFEKRFDLYVKCAKEILKHQD